MISYDTPTKRESEERLLVWLWCFALFGAYELAAERLFSSEDPDESFHPSVCRPLALTSTASTAVGVAATAGRIYDAAPGT